MLPLFSTCLRRVGVLGAFLVLDAALSPAPALQVRADVCDPRITHTTIVLRNGGIVVIDATTVVESEQGVLVLGSSMHQNEGDNVSSEPRLAGVLRAAPGQPFEPV